MSLLVALRLKLLLWRWLARVSCNCSLLCCYGDAAHTVFFPAYFIMLHIQQQVNNQFGDLLRSASNEFTDFYYLRCVIT